MNDGIKAVGIDLAGVERRPTGFCALSQGLEAKLCILYNDREIVRQVLRTEPEVVTVDAPLFLPKGRRSLEERSTVHLRECDRALAKMSIKFFPITLGPMRKLTERGMNLRKTLEDRKFTVLEIYPGAIQDILGMPRKTKSVEGLREALIAYGLKGDILNEKITHDELDAATSALMGILYLRGEYSAVGDPAEGLMIIPKKGREGNS